MADRSVTIRIQANVQGLVAGYRTAQKATADFGSQTQKFAQNNRQSLEEVGQAGMVAGGVLAAGFGLALTKFASFDKAMSGVQAATHATTGDMELLREAAIKTGADTAFSAEEAAKGIEEMAKAGVSTADILGGGLDGALALAAAGSLEVGEAAELASTAMTQFGLSGEDIPHIADLLAAGAGKAQGSVQDMGQALKQAGLVADGVGLTIEETTGGLAAFASAGLVGERAGTSFKSMLQRLTPQSKEAKDKMVELGLSAYNSQGDFIGLSEYAGELQTALGDMTAEQRNSTMATLFGSDAVLAASVLYEQGSKGVEKWEEAVSDAGYAAETAALMQDNLAGDLEKLGGAFDTVFLQAGSGANDALRGLVQTLEDVVDAVGKIPTPVLSAVGVVAGLTGGALLLGGAFITAVPRIADTVSAISDLRAKAPRATSALGKLGKAAGIAAVGFIALQAASSVNNSLGGGAKSAEEMAQALLRAKNEGKSLEDVFSSDTFSNANNFANFQDDIGGVGDAVARVNDLSFGDTMNDWVHGLTGMKGPANEVRESLTSIDEALLGYVSSGNVEAAADGFRRIAEDAEASGVSLETTAESFPQYINSLRELATGAGVALTDQELLNWAMGEVPAAMEAAAGSTEKQAAAAEQAAAAAEEAAVASEEMEEALAEVGLSADGTVTSLETFIGVLQESGLLTLSANDAARGYEEAIDAVGIGIEKLIADNGSLAGVLNATADGFNRDTQAGRDAETMFDGLASAAATNTQAMADAGGTQEELQTQLGNTYDSLITAAGQFGITGEQADALARDVMGIPAEAKIDTWMSDSAKRMAEETTGAAEAIPDSVRIESSMSAAAKETADATKKSADDVPEQETIDSWMSDKAFIEAIRTRAAALGIPESEAIDSYMSSAARNEADKTTARVLGIPEGASVSSYMEAYARIEADALKASLDRVDGRSVNTYATHTNKVINVTERNEIVRPGQVGRNANGGRIPRNATGGRLPTTGPGTDTTDGILGVLGNGTPISLLDGGEQITSSAMTNKHSSLLWAIHRDDPRLSSIPALAGGGRVSSGYAPMSPAYAGGSGVGASIDYERLASLINAKPVIANLRIGNRDVAQANIVGRKELRL
ncbi:phage tail tape measure protein [Arthrobacter roseus]|uniref:phage tail tape measure protein n=1 Tax=Arthrobacter roseus TaxID=136274 RepID=UPI0019651D8F|nr:phage tail tape measure protein [Arthrobacter roseus]MBM7847456.1 TP901 family phage tail tape measure protein [Arthrobacter roseus]